MIAILNPAITSLPNCRNETTLFIVYDFLHRGAGKWFIVFRLTCTPYITIKLKPCQLWQGFIVCGDVHRSHTSDFKGKEIMSDRNAYQTKSNRTKNEYKRANHTVHACDYPSSGVLSIVRSGCRLKSKIG